MAFLLPNLVVRAIRKARGKSRPEQEIRIDWFVEDVVAKIESSMESRVVIATELLRSQTVKNISKPVRKGTGPKGGKIIGDRSKPGEFPRADTGQLMRTLLTDVREVRDGVFEGSVSTPLDYGVILEVRKKRSFLRRTLNEELPRIKAILGEVIE